MKVFDKIYFKLFTKTADLINSKNGHFTIILPKGLRFKREKNFYQIFDLLDSSFLFQISSFVEIDNNCLEFNVEKELSIELKNNPNAIIYPIGKHNCICSATVTKDESLRTYTWKLGERNKRVLITFLIKNIKKEKVNEKVEIALGLINNLTINHI